MEFVRLTLEEYIAEVLPHTYEHWGDGRTYERYVDDLRAGAAARYSERRFAFFGLRAAGELQASLKRYDRDLRFGERSLRASGIGAVFVPPHRRGRGLAGRLLADFLERERARGVDAAFLFSDVGTTLYEAAGFCALPSRTFSLRVSSLASGAVAAEPYDPADWRPAARCYEALCAQSSFLLRRTPLVWDWFAQRARRAARPAVRLRAMHGQQCLAYAVLYRDPDNDAVTLVDCAFDPLRGAALLQPLIREAAGRFRNVNGWLPPELVRARLPQGSVKRRAQAIAMLAPLSIAASRVFKRARAPMTASAGDFFWWLDHV